MLFFWERNNKKYFECKKKTFCFMLSRNIQQLCSRGEFLGGKRMMSIVIDISSKHCLVIHKMMIMNRIKVSDELIKL